MDFNVGAKSVKEKFKGPTDKLRLGKNPFVSTSNLRPVKSIIGEMPKTNEGFVQKKLRLVISLIRQYRREN